MRTPARRSGDTARHPHRLELEAGAEAEAVVAHRHQQRKSSPFRGLSRRHLPARREVLQRGDVAVAALPLLRLPETHAAWPIGLEMQLIPRAFSSWRAATLSAWMRRPDNLIRHLEKVASWTPASAGTASP